MSSKNEQFLLIIKQYWGPTCARDIKKKYKSSSLSLTARTGEGRRGIWGEAFVQKGQICGRRLFDKYC